MGDSNIRDQTFLKTKYTLTKRNKHYRVTELRSALSAYLSLVKMASLLTTCIYKRLCLFRFNHKPFFIPHNQSKGWNFLLNFNNPYFKFSILFNFSVSFVGYNNLYRRFLVSSSMASGAKENPSNNPGLHVTPDDATKGYIMQQTVSHCFCTCSFLIFPVIVYNMFEENCMLIDRLCKWIGLGAGVAFSGFGWWVCQVCVILKFVNLLKFKKN